MDRPSYYPASPAGVPPGLTESTAQYRRQIRLVLVSLGLFVLVYFGILATCTLFLLWSVHSLLFGGRQQASIVQTVLQLSLSPPLFLLLIYMLKNLLRSSRAGEDGSVEVVPEDQPRLFDFIGRLCAETGAPLPKRVFVNGDVNAIAYCHGDSFWRLFRVGEKHLHIGLALVDAVNLTEFKALLAHEFGHFAQKSVRIGAFVYVALGVVNRIVDGRDLFDRLVDDWCRVPWLLAWPAWIFAAILWPLRQLLICLRQVLFFHHTSLMRQMELNADLVAVSVTGSDAPVHMLVRGEFAAQCMQQTLTDLQIVLDHRRCTKDLFHHLALAGPYIRQRLRQANVGVPPPLPLDPHVTTCLFEADDDEQAKRWSTHPSHHERERNAKAHYIRAEFDERSAWLLFDNVEELRAEVTRRFYAARFKVPKHATYANPEEIQAFIDDERAEIAYDPRYDGLYDFRNLVLDDAATLTDDAQCTRGSIADLMQAHANLWTNEVRERGQLHNQRLADLQRLLPIADGLRLPSDVAFEFRGVTYRPHDAHALLKELQVELESDRQWLAELDRDVFVTHLQMALHLSSELADDLNARYRFHIELQRIWNELKNHDAPLGAAMEFLQQHRSHRLNTASLQNALPVFRAAHHALRDALRAAEEMRLPPLKNMVAGQPLRTFLLESKLVAGISKHDSTLSGKWIRTLSEQIREVRKKVDRVHFKSLGGLLALQERIAQECHECWSNLPSAEASCPSVDQNEGMVQKPVVAGNTGRKEEEKEEE